MDTLWCDDRELEKEIQEKSKEDLLEYEPPKGKVRMTGGIKTLCKPLAKNMGKVQGKCFYTGKPAKCWILWGRSY